MKIFVENQKEFLKASKIAPRTTEIIWIEDKFTREIYKLRLDTWLKTQKGCYVSHGLIQHMTLVDKTVYNTLHNMAQELGAIFIRRELSMQCLRCGQGLAEQIINRKIRLHFCTACRDELRKSLK